VNRRWFIMKTGAAVLFPAAASTAELRMMAPEESVELEHRTRVTRLRRVVGEHGIFPAPAFFQYAIPAEMMPKDFQLSTPVLRIVFPENTFFATAKSDIEPRAYSIVSAMAETLEGDVPDVAVFVAGHTDSRGGEGYNHDLSVERARAVANALRIAGAVAPDIWSVGFGESLPLYDNSSDVNMAYNRRVEFLLAARPEAAANWLKDQMSVACSETAGDARLRCLGSLAEKRRTYTVENIAKVVVPRRPAAKVAAAGEKSSVVQPPKRQIVINLEERTYVIARPRL